MAGSRTDTADIPRRGAHDSSPNRDEETAEDGLTIEQLAAEVGMSVRNIRNHQSRGLLPAPEVRARVGYYDAEHVARLRLILDLQADGFNLAAIERLMSSSGGVASRLLGLRNAMTTPYATESPEVVTAEDLERRFGEVDAKSVERIRKLKLLIPLGDDRFEVPSPALMKAAEEVTALGIPLPAALALVERVIARLRIDLQGLCQAVPGRALGAIRAGRPARRALGGDDRGDRRAAADRLGGAAGDLQAAHDHPGRARLRQGARAADQALEISAPG